MCLAHLKIIHALLFVLSGCPASFHYHQIFKFTLYLKVIFQVSEFQNLLCPHFDLVNFEICPITFTN
jgi:hypothetical protein